MNRPADLHDQMIALWIHDVRSYHTMHEDGGNLALALSDGHLDDKTLDYLIIVCKKLKDMKGHEVSALLTTFTEEQRLYMFNRFKEEYTKPYKF